MSDTPVQSLSRVLVLLMKAVVYQETDAADWQALLNLQTRVRDHVGLLGLELILDEAEGYAWLRQRASVEGEADVPRLVPRRQLTYRVSLLLSLLRRKLAETDAKGGDSRLILSTEEIVDLLRFFLPGTGNDARLIDKVGGDINKVVELGFLRRLRGKDDQFEVRRILKAFVDAQWLSELLERYREYGARAVSDREGAE